MDTELARTFLTVIAAGNFSAASSRLHVTQSTVSARIAALEDQLGCRLFIRNKGGTELTAKGRWFQSHAITLVRTVERARQQIGIAGGLSSSVTIGGRFGLWESFLLGVLPRLRAAAPELAVRSEVGFEEDLMQGLVDGRLDIAVMYTPQNRPGLSVRPLFEETLVYVCTARSGSDLPGRNYVHVDWGAEFSNAHHVAFPDFAGSALSANVGWLGLQHILAHGGSGYFPLRLVAGEIRRGRLHRRRKAPDFVLPAYVVHRAEADPETDGLALELIMEAARDMHRKDR